VPKSRTNSLDTLVELQTSKADLERRERDARHRACLDLGSQVLDSGLPLADLAELETLLVRVKKLTMREALMRLSQRSKHELVDASASSADADGDTAHSRFYRGELADVPA
jgi:hypothetical protein